jgi:hypothetical protein
MLWTMQVIPAHWVSQMNLFCQVSCCMPETQHASAGCGSKTHWLRPSRSSAALRRNSVLPHSLQACRKPQAWLSTLTQSSLPDVATRPYRACLHPSTLRSALQTLPKMLHGCGSLNHTHGSQLCRESGLGSQICATFRARLAAHKAVWRGANMPRKAVLPQRAVSSAAGFRAMPAML